MQHRAQYPVKLSTVRHPGAAFYLQAKGLHSGRPTRTPIPNSFAVYCDHPEAYAAAFVAFAAAAYRPRLRGSVVPFLALGDARDILQQYVDRITPANVDRYHAVRTAHGLAAQLAARAARAQTLVHALARSL
jgi:hypothetical protein